MNYLSGILVFINVILSVRHLNEIFYIKGIRIENGEEVIKRKAIYGAIFTFSCTFIMSVIGYLINCTFLEFEARVSGVLEFSILIILTISINIFIKDKKGYKLKKAFKYEKYLGKVKYIIIFSILSTFINTIITLK